MKSKQVWMKSSPAASDEIKSASITPRKRDFIAKRFHPRSGFIPQKADLVEKDSRLYPILSLFLERITGDEAKTVENRFSRRKSTKQGAREGLNVRQMATMRLDRTRTHGG